MCSFVGFMLVLGWALRPRFDGIQIKPAPTALRMSRPGGAGAAQRNRGRVYPLVGPPRALRARPGKSAQGAPESAAPLSPTAKRSDSTVRGSAAADSGKTRHTNQNQTQARCATHTRAEGGRLQPLVMRHSQVHYFPSLRRTARVVRSTSK